MLYYNILGWLISGSLLLALVLELGYLGAVQIMNIKYVWRGARRLWSRARSVLTKTKKSKTNVRRVRPQIPIRQNANDTSIGPILGVNEPKDT